MVTLIAFGGTCVTALSGYAAIKARNAAKNTQQNGRGTLMAMLGRIEDKVDGISEWSIRHEEQHNHNNLPDRVELLEGEQRWRP